MYQVGSSPKQKAWGDFWIGPSKTRLLLIPIPPFQQNLWRNLHVVCACVCCTKVPIRRDDSKYNHIWSDSVATAQVLFFSLDCVFNWIPVLYAIFHRFVVERQRSAQQQCRSAHRQRQLFLGSMLGAMSCYALKHNFPFLLLLACSSTCTHIHAKAVTEPTLRLQREQLDSNP